MKVCKYNTRESSPLPQLEYTYYIHNTFTSGKNFNNNIY